MTIAELLQKVDLPESLLNDRRVYLKTVQQGVSGRLVKEGIKHLNERELFISLLDTDSKNLSRFYAKEALNSILSEIILDTLKLFHYAANVFDNLEIALDWFHTPIPALGGEKPIDLSSTFEGRKFVREALKAIEYGEFS